VVSRQTRLTDLKSETNSSMPDSPFFNTNNLRPTFAFDVRSENLMSSIALAPQCHAPEGRRDAAAAYAAAVGVDPSVEWQMEAGEQTALVALLAGLRPKVAVEIGSRYGGSMQVIARYAQRVISLDIDPTCQARLGPTYPNAEFITGPSQQTFGPFLKTLQRDNAELSFVLIDGDHSAQGAKGDIECLLNYRPRCPLFVLIHDSFNPQVRSGIRTARWSENRYVHSVELDFIPGKLAKGGDENREMWGGFALAILMPETRAGDLQISARMQHMYEAVFRHSAHWFFDPQTLAARCVRKLKRMCGISARPQPPSAHPNLQSV
jgi:hypothetical protein